MGECAALVRLAYTVSGMQSSRCGHGWRISRAAAVFLAAVLLAQANIIPNSRPEAGDVEFDGTCNNDVLGDTQGMRCARG